MNKAQLKGRETKVMNHLSQDIDEICVTYERQAILRKGDGYEDTRTRVA